LRLLCIGSPGKNSSSSFPKPSPSSTINVSCFPALWKSRLASNQQKRFSRSILLFLHGESDFPAAFCFSFTAKAIFPAAFCFSFTAKAISPQHFAFPSRRKRIPRSILLFLHGKSDFPDNLSPCPHRKPLY